MQTTSRITTTDCSSRFRMYRIILSASSFLYSPKRFFSVRSTGSEKTLRFRDGPKTGQPPRK
ncbi:MAG: hypothetical protein J6T99_02905, partial [Oscillospiraceae bacterium]|nr:hypothetical protein [Oscillospiraceae bacterium]